jgi:hypothetical protein
MIAATQCKNIHFIHIGKTGGTSFKRLLQTKSSSRFKTHGHNFKLGGSEDLRDCYTFFVRDPVDRWVSGFLSRLRQGCPSLCHRGRSSEFAVFHRYPTPNALAEALCGWDDMAYWAENTIFHTRNSFVTYLPPQKLVKNIHRILFVGTLSNFTADSLTMATLAGGNLGKGKLGLLPQACTDTLPRCKSTSNSRQKPDVSLRSGSPEIMKYLKD